MKIIKKGKIKSVETKKTCGYCKTKFSYDPKDIIIDQRDGNYVKCPVCKKGLNV